MDLQEGEKLGDFTAWQGALFSDYKPKNCYGIELDEANFAVLQNRWFKNIVYWNFFEKIDEMPEVDALILNPPYLKNSNEFIFKSLQKLKNEWKFAIISKENDFKRFYKDFETENLNCVLAMDFDTNVFKPFASVKTLLIFGIKGQKQWEFCIQKFSNNEIKVNTRAKNIEIKILSPKEEITGQKNFWEELNKAPEIEPPTLEDFRKTVCNYMAWELWIPVEFLLYPEKWHNFQRKLSEYRNNLFPDANAIKNDHTFIKKQRSQKNINQLYFDI